MLYILTNEKKQMNWQPVYEETYQRMLTKYEVAYEMTSAEVLIDAVTHGVVTLTEKDHLWIMHYEDLTNHREFLIHTKAKVIFRMSGTSTHPYCYQVDMKSEDDAIQNVIDYNLVFHPRMKEYLERFYPNKLFIPTGYPIHVDTNRAIRSAEHRTKEIVIGGRLSPDKQPMLSMFLLTPLVKEYKITFCYVDNNGKDTQWLDAYGGKERYERIGFNFEKLSKEDWLNRVARAEFYFSTSLGDTSCISIIEAFQLGAYPVVPHFEKDLPVYDTYMKWGYEPFSQGSVLAMFKDKPEQEYDNTWYDPDKWAVRFKALIEHGVDV